MIKAHLSDLRIGPPPSTRGRSRRLLRPDRTDIMKEYIMRDRKEKPMSICTILVQYSFSQALQGQQQTEDKGLASKGQGGQPEAGRWLSTPAKDQVETSSEATAAEGEGRQRLQEEVLHTLNSPLKLAKFPLKLAKFPLKLVKILLKLAKFPLKLAKILLKLIKKPLKLTKNQLIWVHIQHRNQDMVDRFETEDKSLGSKGAARPWGPRREEVIERAKKNSEKKVKVTLEFEFPANSIVSRVL